MIGESPAKYPTKYGIVMQYDNPRSLAIKVCERYAHLKALASNVTSGCKVTILPVEEITLEEVAKE